nr:type I restriction-modification system endonuclease [Pseudodesulfovibrio sp.]
MPDESTAFQSPNFWFLADHDQLLLKCAAQAERLVFFDPNAALSKIRLFSELLAKQVAVRSAVPLYEGDTALRVLQRLDDEGVLTAKVNQIFHMLRKAGNIAVHDLGGESKHALDALRFARILAIWFHQVFGKDKAFDPGVFLPPPKPKEVNESLSDELDDLRKKLAKTEKAQLEAQSKADATYQRLAKTEELLKDTEDQQKQEQARFVERLADLQASVATQSSEEINTTKATLKKVAESSVDLDENDTRKLIDDQLRDAGWEADSGRLSFKVGVRPQKGKNLAIAEWPTRHPETGKRNWADYVLFIGLTPVATVEAKRRRKDVSAALKQAQRYSKGYVIQSDEKLPEGSPWDDHVIPFLLSSNGRPFLKQLRTKSGVWFRDVRVPTEIARPLTTWPTPEGLVGLLRQDIPAANDTLKKTPSDYLDLRYYQYDAIHAIENEIANGKRDIMTAMATGTGKTRTCIGLAYRLCKAKRFRRILFLVDRTSLGEQTSGAFKDVRVEGHDTFASVYDIKELGDIKPEKDTRLQIATIQGMIKRLLFPSEGDLPMPVDQYDCVIVDECHRGYNLDREMSDTELTFRNQNDYVSKYARVLDHFDAVKIGLTATPALHTTEIFGEPVYNYSYRQAVIDGFLVDHEPPVRIRTKLSEEGIKWNKGEEAETVDSITGEVGKWRFKDEVEFDVEEFNKQVLTEPFNRVVCEEVAQHIDPSFEGKTLVYCVTDNHADMVVDLLKQAFVKQYGSIEDDAVVKITGQADKPLELIRHFKNERLPNVVVTVDLLTTGIDVPKITNLVFIRRVKSRILYEQMLGRATRLCEEIGKDWFRIFDAVDLYSALQSYSDMKPVVSNVKTSFGELLHELEEAQDDDVRQVIVDQYRAKFQRKKRLLKDDTLDKFVTMTGKEPQAFANDLGERALGDVVNDLLALPKLGPFLDNLKPPNKVHLISDHEDELRSVERGYGDAEKPEDYLESFKKFIRANKNQVAALKIVLQRPRELTRQQLKELRLFLDEHEYTEVNLRTAWRETTNHDIAASIIGFIRRLALGSPLVPYEQRVEQAMNRILANRQWTDPQRKWLERIGKQMRAETIVDRESLDGGEFQAHGGFNRLNRVFGGKLEEVLGEINESLWDEVG